LDAWDVGLPSVRDFVRINTDGANSIGKVSVRSEVRKKLLEGALGYGFLESVEGPVRHAAAKSYGG
jgi:hypothetical protein